MVELASEHGARMTAMAGKLHALSPLATLARGYAVARDASGTTLASKSDFVPGVDFELLLRDGTVRATTLSVLDAAPAAEERT